MRRVRRMRRARVPPLYDPLGMPIRRILVANRGEIAVRVFRTCRELGIGTVAVVAPDDRGALHARSADAVVEISSYLDASEHVRAAREADADAIHPGYGFLAESGDFAEAVLAAGLTWIGPPPEALRLGGDKLAAKRVATKAGVPVVPTGEADQIGYPLLVKAAAGGGGRGMRVVREPAALEEARAAASREAEAAFGDGTVFCERYVERPRHVEIQLLADSHGTVISLGERECSVQRRHQKVLEESPSPALDPELRAAMSDAAIAFARAIGYAGAGTAEFMLAGREFWFLELNARIQVEHPVTELVTGIDIVREQLLVAMGERLAFRQEAVVLRGHAIECRINAEAAHKGFLPWPGVITAYHEPAGPGVRVDSGVELGFKVPSFYDSLLAKVAVWDTNRERATARMLRALAEFELEGPASLVPFHRAFLASPQWAAAETGRDLLLDADWLAATEPLPAEPPAPEPPATEQVSPPIPDGG